MTPQSGNRVLTSLGNSSLCWTVFARNRDTAVPAEGNGDLQTLICVFVARSGRCRTLSNLVPWQNWMAAYLGYTLRMKMLFCGWPVMVNDTHTRRRRKQTLAVRTGDVESLVDSTVNCGTCGLYTVHLMLVISALASVLVLLPLSFAGFFTYSVKTDLFSWYVFLTFKNRLKTELFSLATRHRWVQKKTQLDCSAIFGLSPN